MYGVRRECRQADGNVFGAALFGTAVLNPLAGVRNDCLTAANVYRAGFRRHAERPMQNHCVFVELRSLAGLDPSGGAPHSSDAGLFRLRIHTSDILFNNFRFVAGGLDN
jgi:hypothetical protein